MRTINHEGKELEVFSTAKFEVTKKEYDKINEFIQSIKNT